MIRFPNFSNQAINVLGPQEKEIIDHHKQIKQEINYHNDDEAMLEYCRQKRREATLACLQALQEHVAQYLNENLSSWWRAKNHYHDHISLRKFDDGFEVIFHCEVSMERSNICSYENWIRQCHPENTRCQKQEIYFKVDDRFYHKDSHHRQLWNSYVDSYECPELKVNARFS